MENSLQSLLDLAGVNAAVVYDGAGRLVAQRGKAVYDRALCEQVGAPISRAVDSIQLQHADWEAVTARFGDGTLMLRSLGEVAGASYVLAVVADATLNPAFAAVAIRVAATKLKRLLAGVQAGGLSGLATSLGSSVGPGPGGSQLGGARGPGSSQLYPPGGHPAGIEMRIGSLTHVPRSSAAAGTSPSSGA